MSLPGLPMPNLTERQVADLVTALLAEGRLREAHATLAKHIRTQRARDLDRVERLFLEWDDAGRPLGEFWRWAHGREPAEPEPSH